MASLEELREIRIKKLEALKKAGIDVYPAKVQRTHSISDTLSKFAWLRITFRSIDLAGRIRSLRTHGGITFATIDDSTGQIQLFFNKKNLDEKSYKNLTETIDIGDFIQAHGTLFRTKAGEKTLRVNNFSIITKSLRPLPEKWHGLQDVEERYRKRYLDLLMNPEVKNNFLVRSRIIVGIREFLEQDGFIEVETPVLQLLSGGAAAKPFKTRLNALDLDLHLRIAPELYLKRLLVGGLEKIYELGRNFRNEGMDASHNPEFTMLEAYAAYQDSEYLKKFVPELLRHVVRKLNGSLTVEYEGKKIDFGGVWKETDYEKLTAKFESQARPAEGITAWDFAKKTLITPTIVSGFPEDLLPLAKSSNDKADAFQIIIGGWELVKAFTELNNPQEQQDRLEKQEKLSQKGSEEAQRLDEEFIEALEYGMPPAAGFGLGIDRLAALLTNSHTLREIILFPTMKPR